MTLLDHVRRPRPDQSTANPDPAFEPVPDSPTRNGATPAEPVAPSPASEPNGTSRTTPIVPPSRRPRTDLHTELKAKVHEELIHDLDPDQLMGDISIASQARRAVEQAAEERIALTDAALPRAERQRLSSEIADEVLGLGPIEPLLRDPAITEIMVNRFDRVYYETNGIIRRADTSFRDDTHVLNIIDKILRPVSRRLDDSSPMVDARLPDGSRVNAIVPPLAVHGPSLTIRKFSRELLTVDDLVRLGTLSRAGGGLSRRLRPCASQHRGVRRHRHRQNHAPEPAVGLHSRARAYRYDRGSGRASDPSGRLGQSRDAAAEHRG